MPPDATPAAVGAPQFVWRPQPGPQEALIACPADEICFGGARGGGKTSGAIGDWLVHSGRYGSAAHGVFFRRRYRDLEGAQTQMARFFRPIGAVWRQQAATWIFPNGSTLKLRHLWDERDADSYQGHEYTWICYEEVGQYPTPRPIDMLRATLRSTQGVKTRLLLTANPGGSGHSWIKQRFVAPARLGYRPIRDPDTGQVRVFIPSKLEDNPILLSADPHYARRLAMTGSKALVRAWLKGDWDVVAGGFLDDVWDAERQVLPAGLQAPRGWRWGRALDWGSSAPAAMVVAAISDGAAPEALAGKVHIPRGSLVIWSELYTVARGPDGEAIANTGLGWTNDRLGREVAKASAGRRFDWSVADPSIWIRAGGPSIHDQMMAAARGEGDPWGFTRADNNRVGGWQGLRKMLAASLEPRPEAPGLWVLEGCAEWLRTVPVLQRDKDKPDDVDCWVAGTMIATPDGERPIEAIRPGDIVCTPVGDRRVLRSYLSGASETVLVHLSNGKVLQGTPRHKIFVRGRGLLPLDQLSCHMILKERIKWQSALSIAVSCIGAIRGAFTTLRAAAMSLADGPASIVRSGSMPATASPLAGTSTIATATTTTTTSPTWSACRRPSTPRCTCGSAYPVTLDAGSRSGVALRPGGPSCATTRGRWWRGRLNGNARAVIAGLLSALDIPARLTALTRARRPPASTSNWSARSAGPSSAGSGTPRGKCGPVRIVAVGRCGKRTPVYNLTVEDAHLFYANGVLSSNTDGEDHLGDATRYAAQRAGGAAGAGRAVAPVSVT